MMKLMTIVRMMMMFVVSRHSPKDAKKEKVQETSQVIINQPTKED